MKAPDGDGSDVENDVNTIKQIEEDQRNGTDNNGQNEPSDHLPLAVIDHLNLLTICNLTWSGRSSLG